MDDVEDKRTQTTRRALNAQHYGFRAPDGTFALSKFVSACGQYGFLLAGLTHFQELIAQTGSLFVVVAAVIAPDSIKKLITMKYGNGASGKE